MGHRRRGNANTRLVVGNLIGRRKGMMKNGPNNTHIPSPLAKGPNIRAEG